MASNGSPISSLKSYTISDSPSIRPSGLHIHEWIDYALVCNEVDYLSNLIRVRWCKRFVRRFGDAQISSHGCRGRIRLNLLIWSRATAAERRDAVIHEACHIIAWHLHGLRIKPHGAEWRQAMMNSGVEPTVCHSIDLVGINRFRVRHCPKANDDRCCVSRRTLAGLRRGQILHCTTCGMRVDDNAVEA